MSRPIPTPLLMKVALEFCRSLLDILRKADDSGSLRTLLEIDQPAHKDPTNVTRKIDQIAQRLAIQIFDFKFGSAIERYGEEGNPLPAAIARTKKTVLLIDPIDGTDLLARGFSNWCSALVFFHPASKSGERILLSVVAHGAGRIYFATPSGASIELPPKIISFDKRGRGIKHRPRNKLKLTREVLPFEDASVCFYGQKAGRFLSVIQRPSLMSKLAEIQSKTEEIKKINEEKKSNELKPPNLRIYNLGGNPMLAKIAEGTVDVVFSPEPGAPHDFVPGAFIAEKAGATLLDLRGSPLSLEDFLLTPSSRRGYVVASSDRLAKETVQILSSSADNASKTSPIP